MFSGTGGSREWWRDLLPKHAASVADQLRFVKRQLGLSLTDLARVCSASRPTIYSWLDGQDPSVSNRRRIARLYALALRCEAAFKQALPTKLVLPDGKTSVDVLSEFDSDIDEMLSTFRDAMPSSAEQRRDVPQSATRINADRVDAIDKFFRTAGDISRR